MQVDIETLIDLGVLPNGEADWPLRTLLDHSHSRTAYYSLKDLLQSPLTEPLEIARRQGALCSLRTIARHINWMELAGLSRDLDRRLPRKAHNLKLDFGGL